MTVLLIDACGRKRQMEIPYFMPVVRVPMPVNVRFIAADKSPIRSMDIPIAEFIYSDEPSYPPIYRQKWPA